MPSSTELTTGFSTTPRAVFAKPRIETSPARAHSTDTVTSVHSTRELNTTTSETAGSDASPRMIFASGMPSSTLLLKMVPIAKMVCETPSIANARDATMRETTNRTRLPPKYATRRRASTGGNDRKSIIRRNRNAGIAMLNVKRVSASDTAGGQRPQRDSA